MIHYKTSEEIEILRENAILVSKTLAEVGKHVAPGVTTKQLDKIAPKLSNIRLVRSLSGKNMPYLGDVFGCLSGKQYKNIIHADKMRFDVPILFDEFCYLTRGHDHQWIDNAIITRSNSALASFFK